MNIKSNTEYVFKTGEKINDDGTIPIIPVCELVRCKDCKHQRIYKKDVCVVCAILDVHVDGNFYCSHGERKENGTD